MTSLQVKTRLKPDGTLQVAVPTGLPESDVDVLLVIRPVDAGSLNAFGGSPWPERFFDTTFGSLHDVPMARRPESLPESREKLR